MKKDKYAFITGANGGIGRAMVCSFAKEGYNIIANIRNENSDFYQFTSAIEKECDVEVRVLCFDLCDYESMRKEVRKLIKEKIIPEVLVNCAGKAGGNLLALTPISQIRDIFEVNLFAGMELTQLLINGMIRRKSGCIINMASFEGLRLYRGNSGYGVSKAAVIAWTQVMAKELGEFGVRVNAIAPGFVDTRMARNTNDEERNRIIDESGIRRMATPDEIAEAAVFLASDKASFITGEILRVDGGLI